MGNYPGITVGQHRGRMRLPDGGRARVLDSPGTYSLSARSADEQVAVAAIAGLPPHPRPDLVVVVVDATQLVRNLYLVLQVIEQHVPVVVALNMTDMLAGSGQEVDAAELARALGVPVAPIVARSGHGMEELRAVIAAALAHPEGARASWRFVPEEPRLVADIDAVAALVPEEWWHGEPVRRRALALWSLLSLDEDDELTDVPRALRDAVGARRAAAHAALRSIEGEVVAGRYRWIEEQAPRFLKQVREVTTFSERIDRVLLNPLFGFVLFVALMTLLFQALFLGADPLISLIEDGFAWLGARSAALLPEGLLADFVVNGLIGGVGAFVVFLPQILLLFLFLGILEDCGYMARMAVVMDRLMKAVGLHGRAFVPMLSGFACAVPAIMATRTMERNRDRLLTMMIIPLMTCSARLPVYGLLIAAVYPPGASQPFAQGTLLVCMYVFGAGTALAAASVLGRTVFKGPRIPLLIELPPYRLPHWPTILRTLFEQCRDFVQKAGTIILLCSVAMWLLLNFPRDAAAEAGRRARRSALESALAAAPDEARRADLRARLEEASAQAASERARDSYAGRLGRLLEPLIAPLGFDWRIGIGIVGSFAAREMFVATMGVVYGAGEEADEHTPALRERLQDARRADGRAVFTPLVCLALLVFFALACQCMSTLAVVYRETRSWRWPALLFLYTALLAWSAGLLVYQGGRLLGLA